MLKISWFEFFVRGIPEEFMVVFAIYTFSKTGIKLKEFIFSGVLFWIVAYLIRLLPIQYGINTILGLIFLIVIINYINKIEIVKAIRAGLITSILLFVSEGVNIFILQFILKTDMKTMMNDPILKTLYGLPSIVLFGIIVIVYYIKLYRRKELNYY